MTDSIPQEWLDLPRTRREAEESGNPYYFTGKACKNGHVSRRRTKDSNCFGCDRDKVEAGKSRRRDAGLKPTPAADAKREGKTSYIGWCGQCNAFVLKFVSSRGCIRCSNERTKKYFSTTDGRKARKRADTKRRNDPSQRIAISLRERVRSALQAQGLRKRNNPTWKLVGCSRDELRSHLEAAFKPGMTWENYGRPDGFMGWEIDHIRPCISFDLTDPEQQRQCFHFTNLQPLWAAENNFKRARSVE